MIRKSTLWPIAALLAALLATLYALPPATMVAADEADDLGGCIALLDTEPAPTTPPLRTPLRVTTWNAMKFAREGSPLVLTALSADSDLLLLQESLRETAPESQHPYRLFAAGYVGGSAQTGVETRSSAAADATCGLQFMEPWLRVPKAVSVGRFPLQGGLSLLVVNLHAINFTLGIDEYAAQLTAVGELLQVHTGPAIVGGDFNNWNEQRQEVLQAFLDEQALGAAKVSPDLRSRHFGVPVDGLYMRGLQSTAASAFPTTASDHNPVSAVLIPASPEARPGNSPAASTPAPEPAPEAVR